MFLPRTITPRKALWLAAIGALTAVGLALFTQYGLGMQPCPWCVLQRLICLAIALAALPGALFAQRMLQVTSLLLVVALALAGGAAAVWQHFFAAASVSCNVTLAEQIISALHLDAAFPYVFAAYASCADAAVTLLGIPYAFWTLALFMLLALLAILALRRPPGNFR
jgi:protein dithiol:quinone oxidoreductase